MLTVVTSFNNEQDGLDAYKEILNRLMELYSGINAVLVDNASQDGTYHKLNEIAHTNPNIKIVRNPNGKGYADGMRVAIKEASNQHVLLFPGDLQYSLDDAQKLIELFSKAFQNNNYHLNIFTNRTKRFDGYFNKLRGFIWKKIIQIKFNLPLKSDPASQMRILCKCCLNISETSDFFWDLEVFLRCFRDNSILQTIEVVFLPRLSGTSSTSSKFFKTEKNALVRLLKMRVETR